LRLIDTVIMEMKMAIASKRIKNIKQKLLIQL
jgi:hypothetical protein